ncbi:unnamed protein product [Sphagnum balticum]
MLSMASSDILEDCSYAWSFSLLKPVKNRMHINPASTTHGIATSPTSPNLHSKTKANIIPRTIEEKFITRVETKDVARLFTCLESTPNLAAAAPPLFYGR